ncbi:hypothetical protein BpHYR1_013853 [Brachionus plicatilis]|uniref:Uncharacterized protein n=1 Tax=Brachionus plicatilis TaxID=10195 RepID=A0A3M7RT73_BRAPC|nr:hypothetical protein BpHYR1_013853 [Brachionus plicatilis]
MAGQLTDRPCGGWPTERPLNDRPCADRPSTKRKIPTEEIKRVVDFFTSRIRKHLDQYIPKNEIPNFAYLVIYDCNSLDL